MWKTFKDGVLKACDEVCGKKSRRDRGDMWWWNEEVKDTIQERKKAAFRELGRFPSEENKTPCKRLRNQTRKIVARTTGKEAEHNLNDLYQNSNSVFCFLRRIKKDVEEGRCFRKRDGRLGSIDEDRAKIWKEPRKRS